MSGSAATARYHHGDLRRALLEAARALLAAGPAEPSLRAVARRAGVSHAAPYHHFAGRPELLQALAEEGFRDLDRSMAEAQAAAPAGAADQLAAAGMGYLLFARRQPQVFRLMTRRDLAPAAGHPGLLAAADAAMARLQAAIARLRRERGLPPGDPLADAWLCWSVVHGLAALVVDGPAAHFAEDPVALGRRVLARLLDAFG